MKYNDHVDGLVEKFLLAFHVYHVDRLVEKFLMAFL